MTVPFPRSSGILLHPTSLPGRFGIGDFGPEAYAFADFLAATGQSIWQMLPLGPTGYGDSPYQLFSAFAGNPLLISPEDLLLDEEDLADAPAFPNDRVDFERVIPWKMKLLDQAYRNFRERAGEALREEYADFCKRNAYWLEHFAEFMALKEANGAEHVWSEWRAGVEAPRERIDAIRYTQFEFFRQFYELKNYCRRLGIRLMGDLPIYVAHDSADVWAHPEMFYLENNRPTVVAGVPPDYFSATGQLWGNPIYRWAEIAQTGYGWWVDRLRASFQMFDLIRLDHFRGFEAFWQVPATEQTAINGKWVKGPGADLFEKVEQALGHLPIVAENLGVITPEVEAIREQFGFPGMSILQFAFGTDPQGPDFRPHNFPRNRVVYTGTHDNDTTMGWWRSGGTADSTRSEGDVKAEKQFALEYLNADGSDMNWVMIRALLASVANTAIFPLQDLLGAGSEARMNTPGKPSGNWRWRFERDRITPDIASRMKRLTEVYDRAH
jgi:4-alpha-glucanotransferase